MIMKCCPFYWRYKSSRMCTYCCECVHAIDADTANPGIGIRDRKSAARKASRDRLHLLQRLRHHSKVSLFVIPTRDSMKRARSQQTACDETARNTISGYRGLCLRNAHAVNSAPCTGMTAAFDAAVAAASRRYSSTTAGKSISPLTSPRGDSV
jgi:hypothetical protein